MVHALLPHDGHGISLGPEAPDLQLATPIDDGSIQLVQVLFRNDREEDCSTEELRAWDGRIIEEDREILESTDPDAIVDMSRKIEMHMPSDRPGMMMRNRLQGAARGARGAGGAALKRGTPVSVRHTKKKAAEAAFEFVVIGYSQARADRGDRPCR